MYRVTEEGTLLSTEIPSGKRCGLGSIPSVRDRRRYDPSRGLRVLDFLYTTASVMGGSCHGPASVQFPHTTWAHRSHPNPRGLHALGILWRKKRLAKDVPSVIRVIPGADYLP